MKTASLRLILFVALCAAGAAVFNAAPASAATGDPVIVSPSGTVPNKWAGPVTVDFASADYGSYDVELSCNDYAYDEVTSFDYQPGSSTTWTWNPPAINGPARCSLDVSSYDTYGSATENFTVSPPPVSVSNVSVSPTPFYPLVRDGYRDSTSMHFHLNTGANLSATVVSRATGKVVRSLDVGWRRAGNRSWSWNGRHADGTPVKVSKYILKMKATNSVSAATARGTAQVATAVVTKRRTLRKWGNQGTAAAANSCYVTRDSYYGTTDLDCWGGKYARVTYGFAIPASAYNLSWRVSGEPSSSDICCQGKITRSGWRPTSRHYSIRAQVNGWRAYTVNRASVSYTYKARI